MNYLYLLNEGFKILDLTNFQFLDTKKCNEFFEENAIILKNNLLRDKTHDISNILCSIKGKLKMLILKKEEVNPKSFNFYSQIDVIPKDFSSKIKNNMNL